MEAIEAAGSATAWLDAEVLLEEATGWSREKVAAEPDSKLPRGASRAFAELVRRRVRREPVAYIVGRKGFRRIEVAVDRRVLIPRPETEQLVEVALELHPRAVLDVGTGSGALALAVADELPDAAIVATDTSAGALDQARENADRLGFADRVRFERGTLPAGERFELLLANLPYLSEGEWEGLQPEITDFEPRSALVAGPTGLEAIESLLAAVKVAEDRPGAVALEIGATQGAAVSDLVRDAGYT